MPNPNYKDTITIYNCFKAVDNPNNTKDTWFRTVLTDCFYKSSIVQTASGTNLSMASSYITRIPADKPYKQYAEWIALSDVEKANYFTVSVDDLVVNGAVTDEITGVSPYTAVNIVSKYKPDSFKIKTFSDNTDGVGSHYRLAGG